MGDWYVIANIPTYFEKHATNSIESYKLVNNEINTTFSFYNKSPKGIRKVYNYNAKIYNHKTNAEWRLKLIWPFKLPYLIIDLDEGYNYAVIGHPNRKYVWIISKTSKINEQLYQSILGKLKKQGYDISNIVRVIQKWDNVNK